MKLNKTFLIVLLTMASCIHTKKPKKKIVLESRDGLIRTEQIEISDSYDRKISKLLSSAYINYKNNNFTKALINYETVKIFTASLDFWHSYAHAYCYLATGQYENSITLLQELIEDKPEIADTYVLLGFNYMRLGKLDLSIDQFNKALSLETHSPRTYYYLNLAKKLKNPKSNNDATIEKAKTEYKEILAKNPYDFETLLEYSYFFTTIGNYKSARKYLEKAKTALNISPEVEEIAYQESLAPYQDPIWHSFYVNFVNGIILHNEKKYVTSNHTFLIALQNPPSGSKLDIAEIYYYISKNLLALKNKEAARRAITIAMDFDPIVGLRAN